MQEFYNKTGIQPYIYLKDYDSSLTTDSAKTAFAEDYYDQYIDNEHTFLFVYFGEYNENDVGYMSYVNGYQVTSVMDAEAIDIFWAYVDNYWYSDLSTTDMFTKIFNDTAKRIMDKSTTAADVGKTFGIVILVIVLIVGVVIILNKVHKNAAAKAAETQAILNADIDTLADKEQDDLLNKYM